MRLETKIAIDRWFGTAAIRSLLLLGRLSGRKRSQDAIQPQTIFVLKLLGLGSIIQATPLLTAMLDLHPDAKIVFVTKRGNEALTNRLPGVSATLTMRDDGPFSLLTSLFRIVRACRTTRDACFINLEAHSKIGPLLTMLSGARWKAGFFRNPRDLAMAPAFDRLVYFNQSSPVAEVYLQLGRALGVDAISPPLSGFRTFPRDEADADRFLAESGICSGNMRLVLINPNASELRLERRWGPDRFTAAIDGLASADPDLRFVLTGAPSEWALGETILTGVRADLRKRVINASGRVSMGGLIALIRKASLLITNDSGPMHMALAQSTPTVALYGPVEPERYTFNHTGTSVFLYHRTYCSPCVHHFEIAPCGGNNICMQQITVEEVLTAARALLLTQPVPPVVYRKVAYWDRNRPIGVVGAAA